MDLKVESKNKLREEIEQQLKIVPEGQRIHLHKELLEDLLFVKYNESNVKVKIPAWSGEFLRKIDLSEIDFSYVSWGFYCDLIDDSKLLVNSGITTPTADIISKILKSNGAKLNNAGELQYVDYSYTNAKINLNECFESKYFGGLVRAYNTNFAGIDLSKSKFDKFAFQDCNFDYTNINLPYLTYSSEDNLNCSYAGCDMSKFTVDVDRFYDCCSNYKDTGLHIQDHYSGHYNVDITEEEEPTIYRFLKAKSEGKLDGCYINGELYYSLDKKVIDSTLNSIEQQIGKYK